MNQIITKLKGKNIVAIYLVFLLLSILTSLTSIVGALFGGVAKVFSLLIVPFALYLHWTFASKAILEEEVAVKALKFFLAGAVLSFVINSLSLFQSFSLMYTLGYTLYWIITIAPGLIYIGAYVFGLKSLNDEYKTAWYLAIVYQTLSVIFILNSVLIESNVLGIIAIPSSLVVLILLIINLNKAQKQERVIATNSSYNNNYRSVSSSNNEMSNTIEAINKIKALYDSGVLTEEEYLAEKKKLINN